MPEKISPAGQSRSPSIGDFEDFTAFALDASDVEELAASFGECTLAWTTKRGFPMAVVMAYVYRHGSFWTNCSAHRKRVTALRDRPLAALVLNRDGKMATFQGVVAIHSPGDPDWADVHAWFYAALSGAEREPDNNFLREFERFLDGPNQVILELKPRLVVSFDFSRFSSTIQSAMAGGPQSRA
jgi:hypothetical protein